MPTYEYQCQHCGHGFELFQQMSDSLKKKCPECKKLKLKRLIGAGSAVVFKGSGFYETDYRSESYKKGAKDAKESSKPKNDSKTPKKKSPEPNKE
jgi:putative FmdB family regulatory protein